MRRRAKNAAPALPIVSPPTCMNDNEHQQLRQRVRRSWKRRRRKSFKIRCCNRSIKASSVTILAIIISCIIIICLQYPLSNKTRIHYDFQCSNNPSMKGVLNDDYCDCQDGSDEPLTSACSHLLVNNRTFSCPSIVSGKTIKLFPSRIRDGIVDCSDGSDEK
jgi:protein kinase C substrate 80K-H